MSKIKSIKIQNLKAISDVSADFNGCTAIITAGNNRGKTTLLRSIPDRIRGEKPEFVLKDGEKSGFGEMTLTTGDRFMWEFTDQKEKLTYITSEGLKMAVTKEVSKKFFPSLFDIDKFLKSQPKQKIEQLQQLTGVDLTILEAEYKSAYEERTVANRIKENERVRLESFNPKPLKVERVNVTELIAEKNKIREKLNSIYLDNKKYNENLRNERYAKLKARENEIDAHYAENNQKEIILKSATDCLTTLRGYGYTGREVLEFINTLPEPVQKEFPEIPEPEFRIEMPDDSELKAIDEKINSAAIINQQAQKYEEYLAQIEKSNKANETAEKADELVKSIEKKKKDLIASAKLPTGISIENDDVFIDGLPLDNKQISTSKLYITALKLAAMNLGEVKYLHFDASPLDRHSLNEIQTWANENDLQLLIEKPDFDGGEIHYELVQELN